MTVAPPYRGRFAPSPTGPLHLGSLLAAFASWVLARQARGEWWVRIEDVDGPRTVEGAAQQQLETLRGFGLVSDGPVLWQSQRDARYAQVLASLIERGDVFACSCSRSDLAASHGIHHACVSRREREHPAWRLRVHAEDHVSFHDGARGEIRQDVYADVGDVVLRRADGCWAYQMAVVVDDHDQGMTDIVRGADLLDSTPRQILLQRRLGWPTPRYLHLPLLLGPDGQKLSKSLAAAPVDAADPLPALRRVWGVLGQPAARLPRSGSLEVWLDAAVRAFDPARLPLRDVEADFATHNESDNNAD